MRKERRKGEEKKRRRRGRKEDIADVTARHRCDFHTRAPVSAG